MGSKVSTPTPPPAPTVGDSIQDYVKAQPQLFQLQLEQAPQEVAQQLQLLQQYGPQFGQALRQAQEATQPELSALNDQLTAFTAKGLENPISDEETDFFADQFKAITGNQVGSGLGASSIAQNLLGVRQSRQDLFSQLALSLTGRQPVAQPQSGQFTNQLAGFTPNQALGFNQGVYSTQGNIFANTPTIKKSNPWAQIGLTALAGGIGAFTGGAGLGLAGTAFPNILQK